jgi:hypothetical protein
VSTPFILPSLRAEAFGYHSRILHHWRAHRMRITPLGGEAAAFVRNGDATADDSYGVVRTLGYDQSRWTGWDLDGDGAADLPALLLERATPSGGNLVGQSEALASWSVSGTPTFGTAHTASGATLDLIGDNDGAAQEYVEKAITFTGNAAKAVRIRVKRGTSPAASGAQILLWDSSAAAARLLCNILFNSDGTLITPVASPGTFLYARRRADLTYDLYFRTTSVTAANTHALRVIPAAVAGEQGNIYAGMVQVENDLISTSYVKNAAAAGGTRLADSLSWPFLARPQAMTMYLRFIELGAVGIASARVAVIGSNALGNPYLYVYTSGSFYRVEYHNGSTSVQATLAAAPAIGDRVELRAVLNANGSVTIAQALNDGAEGTPVTSSAPGTGPAIAASWSAQTFWLNGEAAANAGIALYRESKLIAGVRSLIDCRTRAW